MTSVSDGLEPFRGKARDVRVGTLIQGHKRTKSDVWEVFEMRNPVEQIEHGYTLWWRVRNLATAELAAIPPKVVTANITFMLTPEQMAFAERYGHPPVPPPTWPVDSDEVALLVEKLGATHLATRDNETGEIWCPNYAAGYGHTDEIGGGRLRREEMEHLRLAHGMDTTALEAIVDLPRQLLAIAKAHGDAHHATRMTPGGFPHRHVPEDHTYL